MGWGGGRAEEEHPNVGRSGASPPPPSSSIKLEPLRPADVDTHSNKVSLPDLREIVFLVGQFKGTINKVEKEEFFCIFCENGTFYVCGGADAEPPASAPLFLSKPLRLFYGKKQLFLQLLVTLIRWQVQAVETRVASW